MENLKARVTALNDLIRSNDTLEAIEKFYAIDVQMQENEDPPRKGKKACLETEKANLEKVALVESKLLHQVVDEERNIVFSEWKMLITYKDRRKSSLTQVSVQHWQNGQVSKEKFYYHSLRPADQ